MTSYRAVAPLLLAMAALLAVPVHARQDAAPFIASVEGPQAGGDGLAGLSLPALLERLHVPGVSIAVIKDYKLHWARAYGVADARTGRPVDTATRFQAASISKPVTALAAMRLVQDGKLTLDADINTLLTSWKVPASVFTRTQPVTPRALFSHTSGADDGFGFPGYEPGVAVPTVAQILAHHPLSNVGPLVFGREPYAASRYSGGGLLIMQLAMTESSGQPFAQLLQSTVLTPLGMADSSFAPLPTAQSDRAALAHDEQGHRMSAPWHVHPEQAAAGLWSTPSDLARFIIEIQSAARGPRGKVLDQRFAREMLAPVGVGRYAIGLAVDQRGDGWYFTHSGSNWGYRAWISGHLRKGYGIVIMANGDNGMALMNQIADRVEKAYHWDSLAQGLSQ